MKAAIDKIAYNQILDQAITQIREARIWIAQQINRSSNTIYWNLGKWLFEKKLEEAHGSSIVKQLSIDLRNEFPDMGLSPRNLWNMKRFYQRYHQADTKLQQSVAVLPWRHNLLLLQKVKEDVEVAFYKINTPTLQNILTHTAFACHRSTNPLLCRFSMAMS
ncbi:MAG TPA: hypothetical protein DCM08_06955 [Microscillaceae bacterium]|jgi:hypothetical protein|nr:hypothetical protein [Microscillaceae bacterium]